MSLALEVDGITRYSAQRTSSLFMGFFDYNWLKRARPDTPVTGEIIIATCLRVHTLSYAATYEKWSENELQISYALIENLGLNLSVANARGHYTKYSGDVHNQAAVWETTIELSARWVYNKEGGDGAAVLADPSSPFGSEANVCG